MAEPRGTSGKYSRYRDQGWGEGHLTHRLLWSLEYVIQLISRKTNGGGNGVVEIVWCHVIYFAQSVPYPNSCLWFLKRQKCLLLNMLGWHYFPPDFEARCRTDWMGSTLLTPVGQTRSKLCENECYMIIMHGLNLINSLICYRAEFLANFTQMLTLCREVGKNNDKRCVQVKTLRDPCRCSLIFVLSLLNYL